MFAIIEACGKQYQVEEGRYVDLELLEQTTGEAVTFDNVVMIVDGKKSEVGQPFVAGASVVGKVLKEDKAKKILVYKQRCKKGYRRKQGHRQPFARVMIESIVTKSGAKSEAKTEVKPAAKKPVAKKATTAKTTKTKSEE